MAKNIKNTLQKGVSVKTDKKKKGKRNLKKNKDSDSDDDDDDDYETMSESDSTYVPPKSKRSKKNKRKVDDSEEETDSDEEEEEEEDYDHVELQKMLTQLFPSKYINQRAKKSKKEAESAKKNIRSKHGSKKKRRYVIESDTEEDESEDIEDTEEEESEEEESDEEESEEEESEEEESEDDYEEDEEDNGIVNIVLALDGGSGEKEDETYFDDDADCDSEDEQAFMKEQFPVSSHHIAIDGSNNPLQIGCSTLSDKKKKNKNKKGRRRTPDEAIELTDVEQEYLDLVATKKTLIEQLDKNPKSKILKNAVQECKDSINKLIKKARNKNAKTYHKLIHNDKKRPNEVDYFKRKLSNKEQLRVMNDLKEINSHINIDKPYRIALLDSKMPAKFKAAAMQKLNVLRTMEPGDPEYYKIKNWVDAFMRIPFGMYKNLTVRMDDGLDVCHGFMENAKAVLDDCTYGLNDAKLQIMQMVGQWISNPGSMGTAIAIKGPMGTGKTTLVKEGISKILGREFAFIALGGTGDSSFLEGHSYTYEGSTWGKIVQILIDSKCMNPVIYFDELDKISDTPRGEEIAGILTHLTDTSQNSEFHDKYFSEVDFDLSKCLFIFSYNDESKVNPILRDRMYRIQTKGYDAKEKIIIARDHLLPKIREQVSFAEEDVILPDETLEYIINHTGLTKEEDGVRNLKRCLEIIYTKLNLFRLVKPDANMFSKDIDIEVQFPMTVLKKHVDILIKGEQPMSQSMLAMYI